MTAQAETVSAADAMRQLAKARPGVWLKLKEQEAAMRAKQDQDPDQGPGQGQAAPHANASPTAAADAAGAAVGGSAGGVGVAGSAAAMNQRDETTAAMNEAMHGIEGASGDI